MNDNSGNNMSRILPLELHSFDAVESRPEVHRHRTGGDLAVSELVHRALPERNPEVIRCTRRELRVAVRGEERRGLGHSLSSSLFQLSSFYIHYP